MAATEPVPAVVPVNVTEQLPADRLHVVRSRLPPVAPGVRLNVAVPVGTFEAVIVSATIAVTVAVQLVAVIGTLQLEGETEVDVESLAGPGLIVIVRGELVFTLVPDVALMVA